MPFEKVGRDKYESPSGRKYNLKQVRLYYAGGGHFPGQKGMSEMLPKNHRSNKGVFPKTPSHYSPNAPGAAAKPTLVGRINHAPSSTPMSILKGGKQTFGPLAYSRPADQDSSFAMADRERRRASKDYNARRK